MTQPLGGLGEHCAGCGETEARHCSECYACPDDHAYYCSKEAR